MEVYLGNECWSSPITKLLLWKELYIFVLHARFYTIFSCRWQNIFPRKVCLSSSTQKVVWKCIQIFGAMHVNSLEKALNSSSG